MGGEWESGDCVCAPDRPGTILEQDEVLRRVVVFFRYVSIDRAEGDRWAETRVSRATEVGYRGMLLEAEMALVGRVALVSFSDEAGVWVRFFLTPDAGLIELHYEPADDAHCRLAAQKLAEALGYEFVSWERTAEPGASTIGGDTLRGSG